MEPPKYEPITTWGKLGNYSGVPSLDPSRIGGLGMSWFFWPSQLQRRRVRPACDTSSGSGLRA